MSRLPQLIAFDLDYTLWNLYIDTGYSAPLRRSGNQLNCVLDKYGNPIAFNSDVPQILHFLRDCPDVQLALCSRTDRADLAQQALALLLIPPAANQSNESPKPATTFFDIKEIYPGSKKGHFQEIHRKTGIHYHEMLFFDDEGRNRDVESLGVTFVLVKHGLDMKTFSAGLEAWREQQNSENVSPSP